MVVFNPIADHVNTSGVWPRANELAEDDPALKHICKQVHKILYGYRANELEMYDAIVETKILRFTGTEYADINADFLNCELRPMPSYSMLTKGLRPDCVFLCHKVGKGHPKIFQLADHVCKVEM